MAALTGPPARPVPPRSRGVIALLEENCTVCMLCVQECPDRCISIASHRVSTEPPGGGRPRQRNVLDGFAIDYALCMYCGICVEVCPFDALFWSPEHSYSAASRGPAVDGAAAGLRHGRERLRDWMWTVPPPPPPSPPPSPPL
jgi:NADH-quinone oxidoreductase subunit I